MTSHSVGLGGLRLMPFLMGAIVLAAPLTNLLYVPLAAFVAWGFLALEAMSRQTIPRPDGPARWLLIFAGYAAASYIWTPETMNVQGRVVFIEYFGVFVLFTATRRHASNQRNWRFLTACYLAGALVAAVLVAKAWAAGVSYEVEGRFSIEGVNANYTAYSIATAIPLLFTLYFSVRRTRWTLLASIAAAALLSLGIVLTGCRGAIVALALSGAVWLAALLRRRPLVAALVVGAILAVTWAALPAVEHLIPARVYSLGEEDLSTGRFALWGRAFDVFLSSPFFGQGAGSFAALFGEGVHTHNAALSLLAEMGSAGFLLFAATLWVLFPSLLRGTADGWSRIAGANLIAAWTAIAMTGVWLTAAPAWIAFALVDAAPRGPAPALEPPPASSGVA